MHTDDTIVAISTPAGRGGIGVVRLSGEDSVRIAQALLRRGQEKKEGIGNREQGIGIAEEGTGNRERKDLGAEAVQFNSWRVSYAELADENGATIDRVLVSYFQKPHSYTAEDVIEISCHGAPVVLQFLVSRCLAAGARLAEPGEFTMRAFLNGRIDLTQAEAVRDLIEARTLYQAKVAASQMDGAVSRKLAPAKKRLVDLIALLEAGIDFAEDDVSVASKDEIAARLEPIRDELARLAASFATGKIIHSGLTLAIVGRPNVGKSSLFNCLVEQDRAIVTASPGTTRDLVAETVEIEGVPLRFVDTAGVREAFDEAESIGVRKSYEAATDSDLALLVLNGAEELMREDRELMARLAPLGKLLVVVNKSDLPQRLSREALKAEVTSVAGGTGGQAQAVFVSALKGEGLDKLRRAIIEAALPALTQDRDSEFLTSIRQEKHLLESVEALDGVRRALLGELPHELLLLDLYRALRPLDAITGATTVEDILGNIFSTFCIGK